MPANKSAYSVPEFNTSIQGGVYQATPVIKVGASKKITVIISEGNELEVKELGGEVL